MCVTTIISIITGFIEDRWIISRMPRQTQLGHPYLMAFINGCTDRQCKDKVGVQEVLRGFLKSSAKAFAGVMAKFVLPPYIV